MTSVSKELDKLISETLFQLNALLHSIAHHTPKQYTLLALRFIIAIITGTIRLVENEVPGSAPHLFAGLANTMQLGEWDYFADIVSKLQGELHSSFGIEVQDKTDAANYIGQQLTISLLKSLHELPEPLHTHEIVASAVDTMLKNAILTKAVPDSYQIVFLLSERLRKAMTKMELPTQH